MLYTLYNMLHNQALTPKTIAAIAQKIVWYVDILGAKLLFRLSSLSNIFPPLGSKPFV